MRPHAAGRFIMPASFTIARRRVRSRQAQRAILEAVEPRVLLSTIVVNTLADETTPNSTTSLREAIMQANGGDVITFAPSLAGQITLTQGELNIGKDISINGPGSSGIAVSGNHASRVFEIDSGATVSMRNFTIRDGSAPQGGGIDNSGSLVLTNMVLDGNTAAGANGTLDHPLGGFAYGGGIYNADTFADLTLNNCSLVDNIAQGGNGYSSPDIIDDGGFAVGGAIFNAGTVVANGGYFAGNEAIGGNAGVAGPNSGLSAQGSSGAGGAVYSSRVFTGSHLQFVSNSAQGGISPAQDFAGDAMGGAICAVVDGALTLSDTSLSGNEALGAAGNANNSSGAGTAQGGAIYVSDAALSLESCSIVSNRAVAGTSGRPTISPAMDIEASGGGIYSTSDDLKIDRSTLSGNIAVGVSFAPGVAGASKAGPAYGGGMTLSPGTHPGAIVTNSTIEGNRAVGGNGAAAVGAAHATGGGDAAGGGVWGAGFETLTACTIISNSATGGASGGAGAQAGTSAGGGFAVHVTNNDLIFGDTLIAQNSAQSGRDVAGNVDSQGFDLIGDADGSTGWISSDKLGTTLNPIDPKLSQPTGAVPSRSPLPGSPAIDAGNSFGLSNDQRGKTRPVDLTSVPNAAGGDGSDIGAVEVQALSTPFGGSPFVIPAAGTAMLQAENFDNGGEGVAYHDTDAANRGGAYRTSEGVDIEATNDAGGGYHVGYTRAGEWLDFTIEVTSTGDYDVSFRTAAAAKGGKAHLEVDGMDVIESVSLPYTGGSRTWQTTTIHGVHLTAGQHLLRLVMDIAATNGALGNFNWIGFTHISTPFNGSPFVIPAAGSATLQAEDFDNGGEGVAYHDTEPANRGGAFRPNEGVDIETTNDAGGGYHVGYTRAGEWLNYTIDVAQTGTYDIAFRTAAEASGGRADIEIDGTNVTGSVLLPDTGGSRTWTTTTIPHAYLTAGQHVLHLSMDTAASNGALGNFNWIRFTADSSPTTISTSTATYAQDGASSSTNFGSSPQLLVKTTDWIDYNRESFLKFDIANMGVIHTAMLRLYGSLGDAQDATVTTQVFASDDTSWNENTLTWNDRPASDGGPAAYALINGTADKLYIWDLTNLLHHEQDLGRTSLTLILRNPNQSKSFVQFHSDDASSNRPVIVVT